MKNPYLMEYPYEKPMFNGICYGLLYFLSYTSVDPHQWTPGKPLLFAG
jgi:hypothetical protein